MAIIINREFPKTCGECPCVVYTAEEKKAIGYCNTSDEDYYCKALDRFMEYDKVDGGLDILGKPTDCPLKEVPSGKKIYNDIYYTYVCPKCGNTVMDYDNYCSECGCDFEEQQGEKT